MKKSELTRRDFLRIVSAGTCGAAIHSALEPMSNMAAYAMPHLLGSVIGDKPVLIILNLAGGCSHNIAPGYSGAYRDAFPTLSYSEATSLPLSVEQGLHPSLTLFRDLYNEGSLALVNRCGLDRGSRSHDTDETARFIGAATGIDTMTNSVSGGWAARLTCQMGTIFGGISLGGSNALIQGDCNPPRSFGDLDNFGEDNIRWDERRSVWMRQHRDRVIAQTSGVDSKNFQFIRNGMDNIQASIETIQAATTRPLNLPAGITFPNSGLGNSCFDALKLVAARELGVQFIYMRQGGYDTHSGERASLTNLLTDVNNSLTGLVNGLKALGHWPNVTIMTISEFGRTTENNSGGTDHGNGGPMFVMGGRVNGRIVLPIYDAATQVTNDYFSSIEVNYIEPFRDWVAAAGFDVARVFTKPFNPKNLDLFRI